MRQEGERETGKHDHEGDDEGERRRRANSAVGGGDGRDEKKRRRIQQQWHCFDSDITLLRIRLSAHFLQRAKPKQHGTPRRDHLHANFISTATNIPLVSTSYGTTSLGNRTTRHGSRDLSTLSYNSFLSDSHFASMPDLTLHKTRSIRLPIAHDPFLSLNTKSLGTAPYGRGGNCHASPSVRPYVVSSAISVHTLLYVNHIADLPLPEVSDELYSILLKYTLPVLCLTISRVPRPS